MMSEATCRDLTRCKSDIIARACPSSEPSLNSKISQQWNPQLFQGNIGKRFLEVVPPETSTSHSRAQRVRKILIKEIAFLKNLQTLQKFLHHPCLGQNSSLVQDFLCLVSSIVPYHMKLMDDMSKLSCSIGQTFLKFTDVIDLYTRYCTLAGQVNAIISKISWYHKDEPWQALQKYLDEPVKQLCWYEILFQSFHRMKIKGESASVVKRVYVIFRSAAIEVKEIYDIQVNAYKLLGIQKALVGHQPKVFTPGRKLLKEGWLNKVGSPGCNAKERLFFLFNDILMCCKLSDKSLNWDKPSSLVCCSLISLPSAFVSFVFGAPKLERAIFQVTDGEQSYLLYSKTVGVSQSWVEAIWNAIGSFREIHTLHPKPFKAVNLKRSNVITKRRMPSVHRRVTSTPDISCCEDDQTYL